MSTLILKLWFVACAIFCLYNLSILVEESYEVALISANKSVMDPTFLICRDLSSFPLNETEIYLEVLRDELIDYFNRSEYPDIPISHRKSALNPLETRTYLIFNGFLCFISKEKHEAFNIGILLSQTREFFFPVVYFAFKNSTFDYAQLSWYDSFEQLTVQRKGPPYSNCNENNWEYHCLNECFKKKFRLARYFYKGNETGLIYLKPETNRTIQENEKVCFEKCSKENCEIVQFIIPIFGSKSKKTTLGARPKLSKFDFWVQFIGLVCSFANISLNQFVSLVIQFASSKVKRRRVRIGLFCVKWAILFLSLTYCGYLYTSMIFDHHAAERNPPTKEITRSFIKEKTVRLAICLNIQPYFMRGHLKKTISKLEKATDGALDNHLKSIHLNYQGRLFRIDYILEPKVLFRYINGSPYRCFILTIHPDYKLMPSNPKLTIRFKKPIPFSKFYLLTENENLNEETFEYNSRRAFKKRVVKRLKSSGRCVNYQKRYENCTSRSHCVERCINREAFEKFEKILIYKAVVDKGQFSEEEWNTTYPLRISYDVPSTYHSQYKNISEGCKKKFQDEKPCVEVMFEETVKIIQPEMQTKEIDLLLDFELSIEEFSWFKLLLNIMSTYTIFFSINVLKLLRAIYNFFKRNLRIRNEKIAQLLIYLICSIGFTWHTYRILDMSINEELTYSPDYEIANTVRMPMMVFCLPIEKMIDRNHLLTGNYLDQLTSEMTTESLLESITYLNESSEWTSFNLSLVERFFFMHLKCFRISIDQEYHRMHFHFSVDNPVLKVNFAKWFWSQEKKDRTVFFMTKANETEFSNVVDLLYYDSWKQYSAKQSELTVKYEDHLSFIKQFFSTTYENDFSDFDGQLPELHSSEFRFRTLKVGIEKKDFGFELQDDLFDQFFFAQIKTKAISNLMDNLNYKQKSVFNQLKKVEYSDSHFTFSLSLIKKTQSSENEANLILGLLNVLFWFDLGILDLHPIFVYLYVYLLVWLPTYLIEKITQFLVFSHRWLKKFEVPLYKRLNSRKQNSRQTQV